MQAWELQVERVDNGFLVRWWEEMEAGEFGEHKVVFEAGETYSHPEHYALMHCLMYLTEHFGLQGSKHDEKRISIKLVNQA